MGWLGCSPHSCWQPGWLNKISFPWPPKKTERCGVNLQQFSMNLRWTTSHMQFVIRKSQLCHTDGGGGHGRSQWGSWGATMFSVAKLGITKPESLRISLTEMTVEGSGFLCKRCSFPPPHSLSLIKIAGCCTGAEIWWVLHLDKKRRNFAL